MFLLINLNVLKCKVIYNFRSRDEYDAEYSIPRILLYPTMNNAPTDYTFVDNGRSC